jgi:hypothetical protein
MCERPKSDANQVNAGAGLEKELAEKIADAKTKSGAAHAMISDLCHRRREWVMSIPAREDYDPDLVIGGALRALEIALNVTTVALLEYAAEAALYRTQWKEAETLLRAVEQQRDELKRKHEGRMFRLQDGPAIPWEIVEPHARQAERNHSGQTLERLHERGGLGVMEFWYVMHDMEWPHSRELYVSEHQARAYAHALVNIFTKQREQVESAESRASTEAERARGLEADVAALEAHLVKDEQRDFHLLRGRVAALQAQLETLKLLFERVEGQMWEDNYKPASWDEFRAALSQLPTPAQVASMPVEK